MRIARMIRTALLRYGIRLGLLAVLGYLVAAPAAVVYSAAEPTITKFEVDDNDISRVTGVGVPGQWVALDYTQWNFKSDQSLYSNDNINNCHSFGQKPAGGAVTVGSNGIWQVSGLDIQYLPTGSGGDVCQGGMETRFYIKHAGDTVGDWNDAPLIWWAQPSKSNEGKIGKMKGEVIYAQQASVSIADGPDSNDNDEDGHQDLCSLGLCSGASAKWFCNGGNFPCPSIDIHDGSTIIQPDPEFLFLTGAVQSHKPGGSAIATARKSRGDVGPTINVNVDLNAKINLDCGGNPLNQFFDFFGGLL